MINVDTVITVHDNAHNTRIFLVVNKVTDLN